MPVRRFRLPALLALVIACSALPALAQTTDPVQTTAPADSGVWTVTPFLSFTFKGDTDSTSLGVGGAVGYAFTWNFAVEAELGYVFDMAGDEDEVDWSLIGGSASLLYHVPLENNVTPYAAFGVGFGRAALTMGGVDTSSTEAGFNFGGGVKAPLNDSMSVRGDLRYFKYNDAVPDAWRIYGGLMWTLGR